MKLNKMVLATTLTLGLSSVVAQAANQGQGAVKFTGAIIDAPCSISPESVDQTVELGQVSNSLLNKGGKSTPKAFTINLEHCEIEKDKNNVSVTFTSVESATQKGLLSISGQASGASIAITDGGGKLVELGKPSPLTAVNEGNSALRFAAYLQGEGAPSIVVPGDFTAVADFTLAYQ